MECPATDELAERLARMAQGEGDDALDEHLGECVRCRQQAALAASSDRALSQPGAELSEELKPGAIIGRYEIVELAGQGASSQVYKARDLELDRLVALKVIGSRIALDGLARARLAHEAQVLARLSHPNVATVYELVRSGSRWCLAMEWVAGERLGIFAERLRRRPRGVLAALAQVAEGLAAVHAEGLVHGDVKPDNVLVRADGVAKLVDFGLAVRERVLPPAPLGSGDVDEVTATVPAVRFRAAGTPAYMAAELLAGGAADASSDQYSFCVTLVEVLTGARPFAGQTLAELRAQTQEGAPRGLGGLPRWLRRPVRRGLAPSARDRHPDLAVLARLLRGRGRARGLLLAAAVLGALALGALGVRELARPRHALPADNPAYSLQLAILEQELSRSQDDVTLAAARQLTDRAEADRAYGTAALAALQLGRGLSARGQMAEADRVFRRGMMLAERAADDPLRARLITAGIYMKIGDVADLDGAHELSELADAVMSRLDAAPEARARLRRAQGMVAQRERHGAEAIGFFERALAEARLAYGDDPALVPYLVALARARVEFGGHDEAIRLYEACLRYLPRMTPAERLQPLHDLAMVLIRYGHYQRAREVIDHARQEAARSRDVAGSRRALLVELMAGELLHQAHDPRAVASLDATAWALDAGGPTGVSLHAHLVAAIVALDAGDRPLAERHAAFVRQNLYKVDTPQMNMAVPALDILLGRGDPRTGPAYAFGLITMGPQDPSIWTLLRLLGHMQ